MPGYLARLICQGMEAQAELEALKPVHDPGFFRVSNTKDCPRAVYYGRIGKPVSNPFPADLLEKMAKGDLLHDRVRQVLIPRYTQYRVAYHDPEIVLRGVFKVDLARQETIAVTLEGHSDGLLVPGSLQTEWALWSEPPSFTPIAALEIKSTSNRGYLATAEHRMQPPHYSATYVRQGFRYIALWNLKYPRHPIRDLCVLMYDVNGDKDPSTGLPIKDYWFTFEDEVFQQDLRELAKVERDVRNGQVSPQAYEHKSDWHCKGCTWRDECWGKRARHTQHAAPGRSQKPGAARADRSARADGTVERRPARRATRLADVLGEDRQSAKRGRSAQRTPARKAAGRQGVGSRRGSRQ